MKRILLLAALGALSLFVSCNKENGGKEDVGKKELTIKASIATTKTTVASNAISWNANDAILVTCDGEAYNFTTAAGGANADFTSADGLTQEMVGINPLSAFYGCTQYGAFTINQTQTISGSESQTKLPMYAYTTTAPEKGEVAMTFFPVASVLEITLPAVEMSLNSVTLSPVDETLVAGNLAGQGTVNPVTGKVTSTGNLKSITANFPGGANVAGGLTFRFPIGWFSVSGGMKIVLTYNGTSTYEDILWADVEEFKSYEGTSDAKSYKYIPVSLDIVVGARDVYVSPTGRVGSKGLTADDPATLDYALSSADEGSTIHLAAGTYKPTRAILGDETGLDARKTFEIARGLTLIGAGPGQTILDGDGVYHTVCVTAPSTSKVTLKDLGITGGDTSGATEGTKVTSPVNEANYTDNYGAGLFAAKAEMEMENVKIYGNKGKSAVGAFLNDLKAKLNNIEVSGNSSTENGTGLWAASCDMTIKDCLFTGNDGKGVAAGLYVYSAANAGPSKLVATDCTFTLNVTSGNNSGLYIRGADADSDVQATLTNCIIKKNQGNMGGGFGVTYAKVLFDKCLIEGNEAKNYDTGAATNGANLVYTGADVTLNDCIFRENTAGLAAAIYEFTNDSATKLTVIGSEFSNNSSNGRGGAIYARAQKSSVTLNMVNSTIFNNTSKSTGSALAFHSDNASYPTIGNIYNCTIVKNNCGRTSADVGGAIGIDMPGGTVKVYNSIVSGNTWAANSDAADFFTVANSTIEVHKCISGTDILDVNGGVLDSVPAFDVATMLTAKTEEGKTSVFSLIGTENPAKNYGYDVAGLQSLNAPFESGVILKDQWGNDRTGSAMGAFVGE